MSSAPSDAGAFRDQRRQWLRRATSLYGLDYAEVAGSAEDGRLWRIEVGFVGAAPPGLEPAQFRLRVPEGSVDPAFTVVGVERLEDRGQRAELTVRCLDTDLAATLAGEPRVFEIELVDLPADRFFARAPFRFDGGSVGEAAPAQLARRLPAATEIDYLAKDYESFRSLILDRIAVEAPEWREQNPADLGITLVELLAYAADYLSHRQDAVATEAYLDTAQRRVSVRRHLRLVGYHLDEGSNARVWVQVQADPAVEPFQLPAGTRLLTHAGQLATSETRTDHEAAFEISGHQPTVVLYPSPDYETAIDQGSLVFETLHPQRIDADLNEMRIYSWGTDRYTLPRGATAIALAGAHPGLRRGDVLILEELRDPTTGWPPGDPAHRHAARVAMPPRQGVDPATGVAITEVELHEEDALPFPLTVAAVVGRERLRDLTVARGNVVLADHGETVQELLPEVGGDGPYAPRLARPGLVWSQSYDERAASEGGASAALVQATDRALPAVRLRERRVEEAVGAEVWRPRRDLLESSAFGHEFVVETHDDRTVQLRFGDGDLGRRPLPGTRFEATYRLGGGPAGQIGADSLAHLVEVVPDRATRLGWLAEAAGATGDALPEGLADYLADQPFATATEAGALWGRVRAYAARLRRMPDLAEAREAIRFVPDMGVRLEALGHAAAELGVEVPRDVTEQIARHLRCDLEAPEKLLVTVLRSARASGRAPSAGDVEPALDRHLGVLGVRNPLPAVGGEPEEPVDRARLLGPRAFRRRRSAITEEDWRQRAVRHPEVLDAVARHRCLGSWAAVVLHVHRAGGRPVDARFRRRLAAELEPALLADRDLEVRPPLPLRLEVRLRVEVDRGYVPEAVRQRVLERLSDGEASDGERGFFHPDGFRFGQTLYLADVLEAAMAVPGVLLVTPLVFRPSGQADGEPVLSRIEPGPLEILTLRRRPGSGGGGLRIEIVEAE